MVIKNSIFGGLKSLKNSKRLRLEKSIRFQKVINEVIAGSGTKKQTNGELSFKNAMGLLGINGKHEEANHLLNAWKRLSETNEKTNHKTIATAIEAANQNTNENKIEKAIGKPIEKTYGSNISTKKIPLFVHNCILRAYSVNGMWKEGMKYIHSLEHQKVKLNNVTYSYLLQCFVKNGPVSLALSLLDHMKQRNLEPDPHIYSILMSMCICREDLINFRNILSSMNGSKFGGNLIAYRSSLNACGKIGNWELALELFEQMKDRGVKDDLYAFTRLIDALGKGGKNDLAHSYYLKMKQSEENLVLNLEAYGVLISNAEDLSKAEFYLHEMEKEGIRPNIVIYTSFINMYASIKDLASAEEMILEMEDKGVKPSVVSYNAILKACFATKNIERSLHWMKEMKIRKISPDIYSYNTLINLCVAIDDVERADFVYEKAVKESDIFPYVASDEIHGCDIVIDLHGFSTNTAKAAVKYELKNSAASGRKKRLGIVTGKGKSGKDPIIRGEIIKMLKIRGVCYCLAKNNEGMVIVDIAQ